MTDHGPTTSLPILRMEGIGKAFFGNRVLHDVDCLQVPLTFRSIRVVTERSVARAHGLGLKVHVWTIDEPSLMHRLFDMGVDGIMTDRADVLAGVMRERGYWS